MNAPPPSITCPACAYQAGAPEKALAFAGLMGSVGVGAVVSDALAIGMGIGVALARESPRRQRRVLGGFCKTHKRLFREAKQDLFKKESSGETG